MTKLIVYTLLFTSSFLRASALDDFWNTEVNTDEVKEEEENQKEEVKEICDPKLDREPDVVSEPAAIEDYYIWDGFNWVWGDAEGKAKIHKKANSKPQPKLKVEFVRGIITNGKTTITPIP